MATGNMHRKFSELQVCAFRVMWADRQTDKQRDIYPQESQYFAPFEAK